MKLEAFGDKTLPIQYEWPTKEIMMYLPLSKKIKLNQFAYKIKDDSNNGLSGIQLRFTNGVTSRLFESPHGRKDKLRKGKHTRFDVSEEIRKVSMKVNGKYLNGLRLINRSGGNVLDLSFYNDGKWIKRDIPEGKEIIGIYCNTSQDLIQRLGFILWTPNPTIM